jgi:hypothetical protein
MRLRPHLHATYGRRYLVVMGTDLAKLRPYDSQLCSRFDPRTFDDRINDIAS